MQKQTNTSLLISATCRRCPATAADGQLWTPGANFGAGNISRWWLTWRRDTIPGQQRTPGPPLYSGTPERRQNECRLWPHLWRPRR